MAAGSSQLPLAERIEALFEAVDRFVPDVASLPEAVRVNRRRRAVERIDQTLRSRGTDEISPDTQGELGRLLKKWARSAFADGLPAVEAFEIRCAQEHDLVSARQSGDREQILAALERKFRRDVAAEFGQHEIRGIQTSERVLLDLDRVYVPLHLQPPLAADEAEPREIRFLPGAREPVAEVLAEHRRLLIVGAPGSGKTTLVAWLASGLAARDLARGLRWAERTLPFVMTVRRLKNGEVSSNAIAAHTGCDAEVVRHALESHRAALFVDGLDEAPGPVAAELADSLDTFCSQRPELPVVITSRPAGYVRERGECLARMERTELDAMTTEEVHEFIHKWCLAAEESVTRDESVARDKARDAAEDLIERLENTRPVRRLAQNPLLCTILCVVHRFLGHRIPEHRVTLYEKCTDALLYEWDAAKMPKGSLVGKLDADQKRVLLSDLALRMHEQKQSEIPEQHVISAFTDRLQGFDVPCDAPVIVDEIRDRSGLLVERRPGHFAFSHLTFQEYLAAYEVARKRRAVKVADSFEDPWWHEVIVLTAGMTNVDAGALVRALLRKEDDLATFVAAQCLETAIEIPLKTRRQVETRLEALVPPRYHEAAVRLAHLGWAAAPVLTKALLASKKTVEKLYLIHALWDVDYEPAISALSRVASDHGAYPGESFLASQGFVSVDEYALCALATRAESSELAERAFARAVEQASDHAIKRIRAFLRTRATDAARRLLALLPDRATKARRGKRPSKGS